VILTIGRIWPPYPLACALCKLDDEPLVGRLSNLPYVWPISLLGKIVVKVLIHSLKTSNFTVRKRLQILFGVIS